MFFLECSNLAKFFGKTEVFRGLNFRLEEALCVGIQGPNGSGKSTLMKCLCGLLRPSEGEIIWKIAGDQIRNPQLRYYTGFAAPYVQLYNELSVMENLLFLRRLRPGDFRCLSPDGPPSLSDILETTALSGIADREFGTLSSGQQQRVKLAGALVGDPLILMLDEPGTNLDAKGTALVEDIIARQRKQGGLVFLSSNREEELALSDIRIVLSPLEPKKKIN